MNNTKRRRNDKTVVKEQVIMAATKAFMQHGIRTIRMDDIAADLSISKRTLYELFHDKETLLFEVVAFHRNEMLEYMTEVASKAENVLEVILKFYQKNMLNFQQTSRDFFEDLKKYPKVRKFLEESRRTNLDGAMEVYRRGVEQGIFRKEVNYGIVRALVYEQMDLLVHSELCKSYTLAEIFETVIFMHMRGISTEKGMKIVDDFLQTLKETYHKENESW